MEAVNARVNAVSGYATEALEQAQAADEALARGEIWGPLHGVPFTVKDVFDTVGLLTPLAQRLRKARPPTADATVIARMRQAGAILLAKTNCPPAGKGSDTENSVVGRTLNPYDLTRTPGGSSGGEAALIAAGASPVGLGSDAGGGLRVPAHYCGVLALKPTTGRVPHTGAYNLPGGLSDPRSQIGPLAHTVHDLDLILRIIAGPDFVDAGVAPTPLGNPSAVPLNNLKVAYFIQDPASPVTQEIGHAVGASAQALARAGVHVEESRPVDLVRDAQEIDKVWRVMGGTRGQDIVEMFTAWDYYRSRLLYFMSAYDALLGPVDHHPAPRFDERDPHRFDYTLPFNLTG
ncbi:MAG: amidase, partial [Caldilineae bacterium]